MKTSPIQQVKGKFGDKAKLVSAVQALATDALWINRVNEEKGLGKVSNAKLLRLHAVLSRVKTEFGSRDKLIGAVLTLGKRTADEGYKSRLSGFSAPRLLDLHDSLNKRSKPAAAPVAPAASKPRSKKAKQKAAA
jgi:hypothetical protein